MTADGTLARALAFWARRERGGSSPAPESKPFVRGPKRTTSIFVTLVTLVFASFCVANPGCTPVPIVGYDAAIEDGGDAAARRAMDAGDAEAGPPTPRKEWDAGIDDDAFPSAADGELELRMKHLLEAIAAGDTALAPDLLYPRDAWVRSHDATDPGKAWDHKIKPAFLRDIAKLHKRTKGIERAKFVSFEVGHGITHVQVKARDLKKPVWRVRHSKLTYSIDDKTKRLDIAEMTSFRGAWYVTKLR